MIYPMVKWLPVPAERGPDPERGFFNDLPVTGPARIPLPEGFGGQG